MRPPDRDGARRPRRSSPAVRPAASIACPRSIDELQLDDAELLVAALDDRPSCGARAADRRAGPRRRPGCGSRGRLQLLADLVEPDLGRHGIRVGPAERADRQIACGSGCSGSALPRAGHRCVARPSVRAAGRPGLRRSGRGLRSTCARRNRIFASNRPCPFAAAASSRARPCRLRPAITSVAPSVAWMSVSRSASPASRRPAYRRSEFAHTSRQVTAIAQDDAGGLVRVRRADVVGPMRASVGPRPAPPPACPTRERAGQPGRSGPRRSAARTIFHCHAGNGRHQST